jgi:hypothetical protein
METFSEQKRSKTMNNKMRVIGIGVGLVLLLVVAATWTWAEGDNVTYYACVNNSSGTIFMVAPDEECKNNETKIVWNQVGPPGPAGVDGVDGAPGPPGVDGADGEPGPQGPEGPEGPQGPAGADGAIGPQGPQGEIGPQGPAGADGADGADGATGPQGDPGPAGATGPEGAPGTCSCDITRAEFDELLIRVQTLEGDCTPQPEICDYLDNDCDGEVDENFPNLGALCSAGWGLCTNGGTIVCTMDGLGTECNAAPLPFSEEEICDGADNDCDGEVDEDWKAGGGSTQGGTLGDACSVGVGQCQRAGEVVCTLDGQGTECLGIPGPPEPEICDLLDNDCDGEIDEGCP